ncbi:hypothetical protein SAMD00019534_038370 [Acytostelium subglobosum LB1]|uniref:hypothetical protein n=1 Tax=Acytostelium subglobosum LB1 TaxID=1410327 RepID=UPI000644F25B|nr:hypothetical protein SAMD00019534_038370 [Acytostelium subglobosum LB1]GAM20662.1 hypothetical protein SAMD00019534_038370 [Acytostelium subglobosum LB1]|eukprot:XP_012760183.1 hypothetical protein SAMD00019534_038370 [Acytostelium subglobosum LB1]
MISSICSSNSIVLLLVTIVIVSAETQWTRTTRAQPNDVVDFRLALKQSNLDVLESVLLDVSNPTSANYGKHWTIDQINELIAPPHEVSEEITLWLERSGAFNVVNKGDFIKASALVADVESLFRVEMFHYKHDTKDSHHVIRASSLYTIPSTYSDVIEMVTGISELPITKSRNHPSKSSKTTRRVGTVDPGIVVPWSIQNVYGIPSGYDNNHNTSLCLVEFQDDQSYNKDDLNMFGKQMGIPAINVDRIVGPFAPQYPDTESTLDVQYGGAIAQTASIWFWTVDGWMYEFASDLATTDPAPYVVSMSWGTPETLLCGPSGIGHCTKGETNQQYIARCNVEYIKCGLRGITLLAASGDNGAPGDSNTDCLPKEKPLSTSFPATSPYVTAVGATMLQATSSSGLANHLTDDTPPLCQQVQCATSTVELVCSYPDAQITSSGGFSYFSPLPSWQSSAVEAYLNSGVPLPSASIYNSSNRGFPDVSALGHNYGIYAYGGLENVDGTSASTPVWGGIIALLNSYRLNNNKPTLGFINPLLYSAPATVFNDITIGNNSCTEFCCSPYGFTASKGWDPVTGLGTPIFKNLLAYIQTLP